MSWYTVAILQHYKSASFGMAQSAGVQIPGLTSTSSTWQLSEKYVSQLIYMEREPMLHTKILPFWAVYQLQSKNGELQYLKHYMVPHQLVQHGNHNWSLQSSTNTDFLDNHCTSKSLCLKLSIHRTWNFLTEYKKKYHFQNLKNRSNRSTINCKNKI